MLVSSLAICQPNFVVDTILIPGHYIQKVTSARSSDVWIIEDTSSRNIYRVDKDLSIYNHSVPFQTITNSLFTTILNNDTNNTFVGTMKDYVYQWKNNVISKINSFDGLTDSTINGIVGFPKTSLPYPNPQVLISANKSQFFKTNNYLNFNATTFGALNNVKVLEREKAYSSWWGYTYYYSLFTFKDNNHMEISYSDLNTGYGWGSWNNWQSVNTATVFWDYNPRILIGMNDKMIFYWDNVAIYTYLAGTKVNKIMKYRYDSNYALVGADSGLYIFGYPGLPPIFYKSAFPENSFKVNDVDITSDGCVWLATDAGLIKLKDINCNNYTTSFSVSDSVLMLNQDCEIQFNTLCSSCEKSWHWSFGDGTTSNSSDPSHIYSQSGTYTINLVSGNGVCFDTVTKNITLLICCDSSNYNFANLGPDTSICSGNSLDAGNFQNCNYLWSTGATSQTVSINSSGNYWVGLKNQNGCSAYDTIHVFVNQPPSTNFSGLTNNYCSNASTVNMIGIPAGGIFTGNGVSGNSFSPNIAGVGSHTITYSYTDGNGCSNTKVQAVNVNAIPSVNFSGLVSNYCANSTPVYLTGTPTGGVFSGNGILGNILNQTNAGTGTHPIIYNYTDGNGCSNSDTQYVIINPLPIVSFTGLNDNYCIDELPDTLSAFPIGGTFNGIGIVGNSFNPSIASIGLNTIGYNYTDTNSCNNSTFQITDVAPIPVVSISGDSIICSGEADTLIASGLGSFLWSTGDTTSNITPSPTGTTTYSVTASNFCGNSVDSILINVNPLPLTTISDDTTILLGNSANLSATGGITYSWTPSIGLSCSSCPNPIASPKSTTTYYVKIAGVNGCSVSKKVTITINDNFEIFVPDVFSPNGDGQNDILYVRGTGIKELNFAVYDRLGEIIFESNDLTIGWDGTYKGSSLNSAVFVYYLSVTLINDKKIKTKGDVTLIR